MERRLRTKLVAAVLPLLILLGASAAYAVTISLSSSNVMPIGGTGLVTVNCPAQPCAVSKVTWTLDTSPPFYVASATVSWTPSQDGDYQVCVNLYGSDGNPLNNGSGCITKRLPGGTATSTTVPFSGTGSSRPNPRDINKVEVIIVQTP